MGKTNIIASGDCETKPLGDEALWELSSDGTMTIRGDNENIFCVFMKDGSWSGFSDQIRCIVIDHSMECSIREEAFTNCIGLRRIVISAQDKIDIDKRAFAGCDELKDITIEGRYLPNVEPNAFEGVKIENINLNVSPGLFDECLKDQLFSRFNLSTGGPCGSYPYINNVKWHLSHDFKLTIEGTGKMCQFYNDKRPFWDEFKKRIKAVVVMDGITHIGKMSFYDCTSLTSVSVAESVISIGMSAFKNTPWYDNLPDGDIYIGKTYYRSKGELPYNRTIKIKPGTISISDGAFFHCESLRKIVMPDSLEAIGLSAFEGCILLKEVVIPNSVNRIGDSAFAWCRTLKKVVMPESATKIGSKTFFNCRALEIANIPNGVTEIGPSAFSFCTSLRTINIPDSVNKIGEEAFFFCSSLVRVSTLYNVSEIDLRAFGGCELLDEINFHDNIRVMGPLAFFMCKSLKNITIYSVKSPCIHSNTFGGVDVSNVNLYVPLQGVDEFKNNQEFKDFNIKGI